MPPVRRERSRRRRPTTRVESGRQRSEGWPTSRPRSRARPAQALRATSAHESSGPPRRDRAKAARPLRQTTAASKGHTATKDRPRRDLERQFPGWWACRACGGPIAPRAPMPPSTPREPPMARPPPAACTPRQRATRRPLRPGRPPGPKQPSAPDAGRRQDPPRTGRTRSPNSAHSRRANDSSPNAERRPAFRVRCLPCHRSRTRAR